MDGPTLGLIGGIAGSVIGVLGGAVGTYFSVKNTRGPRERAFMIRCAVVCAVVAWIAIALFLALMFLLPIPYRHYLWIPYAILLPVGIRYCNERQREIFRQEHRHRPAEQ